METNKQNKFRGWLWLGGLVVTRWPSAVLEIQENFLVVKDELFKKKYELSKEQVVKIEIKSFFPVIGKHIRICHSNENYKKKIYFGVFIFKFKKLIKALKESGWKVEGK